MSEPRYTTFRALVGKTITEVIVGEYEDDTTIILEATDRQSECKMYMIQSGSDKSCGIMDIMEIDKIPETFKKDESL